MPHAADRPGTDRIWQTLELSRPDWSLVLPLTESIRAEVASVAAGEELSVDAAAQLLGCRLMTDSVQKTLAKSYLAALIPRAAPDRLFDLFYDADQPRTRQRFSIAHELAHVFFYDRQHRPPRRVPMRESVQEERYCDEVAAELLMPRARLRFVDDLKELVHQARAHRVSPEVATRQKERSGNLPWLAVIGLLWTGSPTKPDDRSLRVKWVVSSPGTYVPLHAKYRSGPALDAYEQGATCSAVGTLALGTLTGARAQTAIRSGEQVLLAVS